MQATDPNQMENLLTNETRPQLLGLGEFHHEYIMAVMQCQGKTYIHHAWSHQEKFIYLR